MKQYSRIFVIVMLILGLASPVANAHSEWFRKGKYHISMVHDGSTGESKYTDPRVSDIYIEIGQDTIKIVKTSKLFTPKFGEGESLDFSMEKVGDAKNEIVYLIDHLAVRTNDDGSLNEYMVCKTTEGVKCAVNVGVAGKDEYGNPVYGMQFTDPEFSALLWTFTDEDLNYYEVYEK